ncbi:DUF1048 domain-containing protein [Microbacterium koreense]|uniref:DUF1048 domain-containing protein n=1 Tax=Microbacterium koreense TaxID=323761 RepID=A0ABW2ZPB3_9MICO
MASKWIEIFTGSLEQKKQWRAYRARVAQLDAPYRDSAEAIERYLLYTGPADGDSLMPMLEDLIDLFEGAQADEIPVRSLVGDDPVEFVESFKQNYGLARWIDKEQQRLTGAIDQAERDQS